MKTTSKQLLIKIAEEFVKGNLEFSKAYLAENIKWNVLGENAIEGKQQVLEISRISQLQSYPVITIKNIIAEENFVVIESTGEAKPEADNHITSVIATFLNLKMNGFRK